MGRSLAAGRRVGGQLVEKALGIHTCGEAWQADLGFSYGLYRPTPWLVLRDLFRRLEVGEDDVFVDVGSGMGRVLLLAARRPFKRVIGVEQNGDMTEIARRNLERGRPRLACQDVELVTADAVEWEIPDDLTVVYFYCPFPDHALERFLDRLGDSLDRRPRALRLIYNFSTTQNREMIMATGRARRTHVPVPRYLRPAFSELWTYRMGA